MRSTLIALVLLLNATWLFSQDDVFSNKTNVALEKVIRDFPNRFHNIRGDMIAQHRTGRRIQNNHICSGRQLLQHYEI